MFYQIFIGYILTNRRSITQFNNLCYDLRYIDALFMLNNNIPVIVVKRWLGDAPSSIILDVPKAWQSPTNPVGSTNFVGPVSIPADGMAEFLISGAR